MRVEIPTPVHKCADTESARFALHAVKVATDANGVTTAVATDGRAAVAVECTAKSAPGEAHLVPVKIFGKTAANRFELNDKAENLKTGVTTQYPEGRYPRMQDCYPAPGTRRNVLTINAHLLKTVADALGTDGIVNLVLPEKNDKGYYDEAIIVTPLVRSLAPRGIAIIMPGIAYPADTTQRRMTAEEVANHAQAVWNSLKESVSLNPEPVVYGD